MPFTHSPGISFCEAAGRRIFLDLPNDRYFCLGDAADAAFTRLLSGNDLSSEDVAVLQKLVQGGMLMSGDWQTPPSPCAAESPEESLLDDENLPRVGGLAMLRAAVALQRAKSDLRRRPLHKLCAEIAAITVRRPRNGDEGGHRALELAAAFAAAGRIVGSLEQCLALSIAMTRRARNDGFRAELVFGVKLRPFQAHAWVQVGRLLISDRIEVVRQFTPILAI